MRRPPDGLTRRPGGFTLLELLVVSVLMILVTMGTAQLWRHFSLQMANINRRATASRELRLALENLRRDMGTIQWATPVEPQRLVMCKALPDGKEVLVEYSLQDQKLVRCDQSTGLAIPVAAWVSSFQVQNVNQSILRMVITVGSGNISRQATLFWSRP